MSAHRTLAVTAPALMALALALSACTAPSAPIPSTEQTQPSPSAPDGTDASDASDDSGEEPITGPLDASGAIDRALQLAPGAVVELGRGRERGADVWEVGVLREDASGIELYIDQQTGELVRESSLRLSSEQRTPPAITASDAVETALAAVPGSIVELDLGTERSTVVWEVLVAADAGGRFELYIDATTADILKQERDD